MLIFGGFPGSSAGKESACNAGDPSSVPGSRRSAGEGIGYPLQYSWASLVAQTLKNLPAMQNIQVPSLGWEDPLEEEMETHSNILAWKIPWTEEPGGLQSMGSLRVRHMWCWRRRHKRRGFRPWVGKIPWRRAWQPTPVFLPGESHGQRSLARRRLQSTGSQRAGHDSNDLTTAK